MTVEAAEVQAAIEAVSALEAARITATLIRITGDWSLAEDCVQDAFARALVDWLERGIPGNPAAWLTTVAKNRAIDCLRSAASEQKAVRELSILARLEGLADDEAGDPAEGDDRLRLIYTCCHPALPLEARVALTLRTVAGLTTAEIARAFLVSEATMSKRLVRARAKIRDAGIPYRVPPPELVSERTAGILAVLYLMFNEGYSAGGGDSLVREPLAREAIRLNRLLIALLDGSPHQPEAMGLLALMLFHHGRRHARTDAAGDLVTLEDQDRELWDREATAEAVALLTAADRIGIVCGSRPGSYRIQAAIAGCHMTAREFGSTDFSRLALLYDRLARLAPSPVVELNRAVAVAMSRGPDAGLALIDELERTRSLEGYYLLPAAKADLLRRLGRMPEAGREYRRARELAPSEAERRYLSKRLAETRREEPGVL
ncbi:RNA polymerase sigma factor [Arthrobacter sp. KBS0702]|uniref:RNA polymerase sigma factor n=1 Tax=Arthrobacter sp. KBS0702 TaxID=2578107 RepID=UPI00110E2859|nr:RNA polymerase sigma factor [Arthrobacter sp. KBS0702]QDW30361.1 RNA polymerase sigma factor [Arthrobacter sp. KBS0702]